MALDVGLRRSEERAKLFHRVLDLSDGLLEVLVRVAPQEVPLDLGLRSGEERAKLLDRVLDLGDGLLEVLVRVAPQELPSTSGSWMSLPDMVPSLLVVYVDFTRSRWRICREPSVRGPTRPPSRCRHKRFGPGGVISIASE